MKNHTERADEIFWTVILSIITALFCFLTYIFFSIHKPAYGYFMAFFALLGTSLVVFGIRTILVRRFAKLEMRKITKGETITTHTKRVMDWFLVAAFFGFACLSGFLLFKSSNHLISDVAFTTAMLTGILFGMIHLREILVRRWAEQRMREIEKEKKENR